MKRIVLMGFDTHRPEAKGAFEYAREASLLLTVMAPFTVAKPSDLLRAWDPAGVMLASQDQPFPLKGAWLKLPIPTVFIHQGKSCPFPNSVNLDFEMSGRLSAQHFIENGFRDLSYCLMAELSALQMQLDGFRAAAEEAGCRFHLLDWTRRPKKYENRTMSGLREWRKEQGE